MSTLDFLQQYNGTLALIATLVIAAAGLYHYLYTKISEERGKQYDRYHRLLEDLNISPRGDAPFIDRQVAVVYELRNFPEYYSVSLRILERSLPHWHSLYMHSKTDNSVSLAPRINSLYLEAKLTEAFIKKKQAEKSYLCLDPED
jgi:hypothetical protein